MSVCQSRTGVNCASAFFSELPRFADYFADLRDQQIASPEEDHRRKTDVWKDERVIALHETQRERRERDG